MIFVFLSSHPSLLRCCLRYLSLCLYVSRILQGSSFFFFKSIVVAFPLCTRYCLCSRSPMRGGILLIAHEANFGQQLNGSGMLLKVGVDSCFFGQQRFGRRVVRDVGHLDRMALYPRSKNVMDVFPCRSCFEGARACVRSRDFVAGIEQGRNLRGRGLL